MPIFFLQQDLISHSMQWSRNRQTMRLCLMKDLWKGLNENNLWYLCSLFASLFTLSGDTTDVASSAVGHWLLPTTGQCVWGGRGGREIGREGQFCEIYVQFLHQLTQTLSCFIPPFVTTKIRIQFI